MYVIPIFTLPTRQQILMNKTSPQDPYLLNSIVNLFIVIIMGVEKGRRMRTSSQNQMTEANVAGEWQAES